MKKILFASAAIIAAMLTISCNPKDDPKEEIPAVIEPALTALDNNHTHHLNINYKKKNSKAYTYNKFRHKIHTLKQQIEHIVHISVNSSDYY